MIVVTGATGLIGSHICLELARRGEIVRGMYAAAGSPEGDSKKKAERVFRFWEPNQAETLLRRVDWVAGDVLETESLCEAFRGADKVIHAAGLVSFHPRDIHRLYSVNGEGTANVVNAALHSGVRRFVHISSVAALGRSRNGELITEQTEWKTSSRNSVYAVSKFQAEREVWRGKEEGLDILVLNPGVVLGPSGNGGSSASLFDAVLQGLKFYSTGSNGFTNILDIVDAALAEGENYYGGRYIVVSRNMPYKDILYAVAKGFGLKPPGIAVNSWMTGIVWRAFALKDILTGSRSLITRETVKNASSSYYYSSEKLEKVLGRKMRGIDEIIPDTCRFFTGLR